MTAVNEQAQSLEEVTSTMSDLPDHEGRKWLHACAFDDIEEDEGLRLETVPPISVFRVDDEAHCIDDTCTHEDFSLADGWQDGCVVECTLHAAKFDLRTGQGTPPAAIPVAVHPVEIRDGEVFAAIPAAYLVRENDSTYLVKD